MRIGVLLGCLVGLGVALTWWVGGGRFAVVTTPSMGEALPVGTFVLTQHRPLPDVRVGDLVTYRPPSSSATWTHRVVAVAPDGAATVRGDLNSAPDPHPVTRDTYVGTVVWHARALGWLLRGLPPVLLSGVLLTVLSARFVPGRWRSSVRVVGVCVAVAVTSFVLRPFVRPVLLLTTSADGVLHVTVVSTGILPTRVTGSGGAHLDLIAGQLGTVAAVPLRPGGPGLVTGAPHLTGWWWLAAAALGALPLVWCLTVGLVDGRAPHRPGQPAD